MKWNSGERKETHMTRRTILSLLTVAVLGWGFSIGEAAEIRVSAAASMKNVINELADSYRKTNPQTVVVLNAGGSGALAKQIEQGAPADIFISASREWSDYLQKKSLLKAGRTEILAHNALVFVGDKGLKVRAMKDLPSLQKVAIGSPKSVPAGEYAAEALKKAGIAPAMEKKLVMARDVAEALMYADRGEVDGAFVYRTDALLAKKVTTLFVVPPHLHAEIAYPVALTAAGSRNAEAEKFMKFLLSVEAGKVLEKAGFAPARPGKSR